MQSKTVETLIGAIVILIAAGFLYFGYINTSQGSLNTYELTARFNRVDGLSVGTDVKMSGIKVGTVSELTLDPKNYLAIVHLSIRKDVQVPEDSSLKITSAQLLGNSYMSLAPGGSDKMLPPGGEIKNTQGSVDIMSLIGRAIYGNTSGTK
ncbi:MAG TPA: outer membrane lipid asymmetry maintenance protein MlaD [Rhizomicrobium sp.]|nr:outer membrane lipid asymmetry maintenance protein MlaD [Rhizomicrobium sp.]